MAVSASADADVLIVGGGLVGLALLAALRPLGLSVVLCDRGPVSPPPQDSGWDTRVYAISPGSVGLLASIGAWQRVDPARLQAIESMRVFGDDGAVLNFSAYDAGERALAWIVESRQLTAALAAEVEPAPAMADSGVRLARAQLVALEIGPERVHVAFEDGRSVHARLVVGADGAQSPTRILAGLPAQVHPYGHTAVVANFDCERPHHGRAWQWFGADGGVLALLPLPGRRVSIVWSVPEALAAELVALDAAALALRVGEGSGFALGSLRLTDGPASFPLGIVRLASPIGPRLVLVGDAAHGIHPLAGQGVNLGFGDVAALRRVLAERAPVTDPGAEVLLERYARLRAEPVFAMQSVTDGLWRLFNHRSPAARQVRNLGMQCVERLPSLKRALMQPALG